MGWSALEAPVPLMHLQKAPSRIDLQSTPASYLMDDILWHYSMYKHLSSREMKVLQLSPCHLTGSGQCSGREKASQQPSTPRTTWQRPVVCFTLCGHYRRFFAFS